MRIEDDPESHRYTVEVDGDVAGFAMYEVRAGRYLLVHTEVDDSYGGRGVGSALARGVLDDMRAKGAGVVPICPFMIGYIDRHPEYADLVDNDVVELLDRPADP